MKTLVVYYSLEGNTKMIAKQVAQALSTDVLELHPQKAYPTGKVKKFLWGGKSAMMAEAPALEAYTIDLTKYDLVVLGTPIWASTFAPPLRTFLKENFIPSHVAFFACSGGGSPLKAFHQLEDLTVPPVAVAHFVDPKDGKTPKQEAKIQHFVETLQKKLG